MSSCVLSNLPYKTKEERKATDHHIKWLRSNLDSNHRISKIRARGPRKKWAVKNGLNPRAYDQDLPIEYAETISVYAGLKPKIREKDWLYARQRALKYLQWDLTSRLDKEINKIREDIKKL